MKNNRMLIAVVMVLLMGVSVYSLFSAAFNKQEQVNDLLQEAQTMKDQGLYAKAVECYSALIDLDQAVEYYNAVADLYYEIGEIESSIKWGEETIEVFPNEVSGYERLLRGYIDCEKYSDAYEAIEIIDGRLLHSDIIETYRAQIQYLFYLEYIAVDEVRAPSGGYASVRQADKWGMITTDGKSFLKTQYAAVGDFANEVAAVCDKDENWYFVNSDGEYSLNISYNIDGKISNVGLYNDELFPMCVDGKYSYYDMSCQVNFGPYDYAGAFNYGIAAVKSGDLWMLIDETGKQVGQNTFEEVIVDSRGVCCMQDRILVKNDGMCYLVDVSGKRIGSTNFEDAKAPSNGEMIAVKIDGKWGFADLNGNVCIAAEYEDAMTYSNGLAAVCIGGLWGYIDSNNNMVISPEYIDCFSFGSNGTALVKTERGWNILKLYSKNY